MTFTCKSLEEVRTRIDAIDRELVVLIARRGALVAQAAGFKKTAAEVPAPQRVEQVIAKVLAQADAAGADPSVVEATWRAMIAAFIEAELRTHRTLTPSPPVS